MKIILANCNFSAVKNPLTLVNTFNKNYVHYDNDRVLYNNGYFLRIYKVIPGQQYKINATLMTSGLCGISYWSKAMSTAVSGEGYYNDGFVSKDTNSKGGTSTSGPKVLTDYVITPQTEYVYLSWRNQETAPTIEWVEPS